MGCTASWLAGLLLALGAAAASHASVQIDVIFRETGTSEVRLDPLDLPETLAADLILQTSEPLTQVAFRLGWDADSPVILAENWRSAPFTNVVPGPAGIVIFGTAIDNARRVAGSFGAASVPLEPPSPAGLAALPPGTYDVGTVVWEVSTQGNRVFSFTEAPSLFSGVFAFREGEIVDISDEVVHASGGWIVPEPATGALLGFGLLTLRAAARLRRRRRR